MSVAGIQGNSASLTAVQLSAAELQQLQQLASTLQINTPTAQGDSVTLSGGAQELSKSVPQGSSAPGATNGAGSQGSTVATEFQTLAQDLQSGNLSGAQQAFSAIAQSLGLSSNSSNPASGANSSSNGSSASGSGGLNQLAQDFESLGKALSSGNLSQAQQAFSQFSQDAQNLSSSNQNASANQTAQGLGSELLQAFLQSQALSGNSSAGSTIDVHA